MRRLLCRIGLHNRWVWEPDHDRLLGAGPWAPVDECQRGCGR